MKPILSLIGENSKIYVEDNCFTYVMSLRAHKLYYAIIYLRCK